MFAAALTLVALGAGLTARALIGRRVGDEPRCRKCKYNLTGVESKECPECGREWTVESAETGLRVRRRASLVLGIGLIVAGAILSAPAIQQKIGSTNWFHYMPTAWVIPAASRGSSDAIDALIWRLDHRRLTYAQTQELIKIALSIQGASAVYPFTSKWMNVLGQLGEADLLSDEQRSKFFDHLLGITINTRQKVRRLERVPIELINDVRGPSAYSGKVYTENLSVDGQQVTLMGESEYWIAFAQCGEERNWSGIAPMTFALGEHHLHMTLRIAIQAGTRHTIDRRVDYESTFAVVADDAVEAIEDAEIQQRLGSLFRAVAFLVPAGPGAGRQLLISPFLTGTSPVDGVFDATILTADGTAFDGGRFSVERGESNCRKLSPYPNGATTAAKPGEFVRVLLTFDPEFANATARITRAWKGKLSIESVRIESFTAVAPMPPGPTAPLNSGS